MILKRKRFVRKELKVLEVKGRERDSRDSKMEETEARDKSAR